MANPNLPELTNRFPTELNGAQTALRPNIILDWSSDMETLQFSDNSQRAKNIVLMLDSSSTVVDTDYVSYTPSSRRLIVSPSSDLNRGTTYRILVKNRLLSTDGRRSFNDYNWIFTTSSGSITVPLPLAPGDGTVQPVFPALSWSSITAVSSAGSALAVNYTLEVDERWDFGSPVYSVNTTATAVIPVGVFSDETTYYWRVQANTIESSGTWSTVRSFFYGRQIASDPTTRQTYPDTNIFALKKLGFTNGATHQSSHPNLSFTFFTAPASDFTNYIQVVSRAVSPRNDDLDSYDSVAVSGTWTQVSSTLTFVPGAAISQNTRYEITFLPELKNNSGYELGQPLRYFWTGRYSPLYASSRAIRARFLGAEQKVPDDLINFYIHQASLEANARYWTMDEIMPEADSPTEATVRDSGNLSSYGVAKWVEAAASYNFLKAILFEHLRDIGRTERLGDSLVSLTEDFVKGINTALELVKGELEQWENYLTPSYLPMTTSISSRWSPRSWDYDWAVKDLEAQRDDFWSEC